ncbi:TonB-dependent receptor family protein [Solitalea sp. MAHUQ-68]|uniref:TonB-dependent receptor family protein n=1 Tax=Solitalea agri TaxID=2953739 RepID=A0A9X2JEN8_9SPHI|nr:outer membrane beta-barrel family protein [Solitalea agri]MCO4292586.1 TonB-dependent receptor family protein [Solitalea agri]
MKKVLLLVLAGLLTLSSYAQKGGPSKGTGTISGVVIDSTSKKPVEFATLALMRLADSKSVNGGLANEKGVFALEGIPNGDYKLIVSFIDYSTVTKKVTITAENQDIKIGKILLQQTGKQLKEVTVVGQRELVENKIDKMVYNAEKDVTSKGGDAGDILRKVPMVSVDMDGNVELRGNSNVKILINGKPSTIVSNSVADAMKMIPADQIKNVEVITSPSAKYDAEGSAGIINIVTKKTDVAGVTGNISMNLSNRFNRGNGSLNIRQGKVGFSAGFGGMYFIPQDGSSVFLRNSFFPDMQNTGVDTARLTNQNGTNKGGRNGGNANFGITYDLNKTNSISSNIKFSRWNNNNDGSMLVSNSDNIDGLLSQYNRISQNDNQRKGIDWSTDYNRKFANPQQELSLGFQLSNDRNNTDFQNSINGIVNMPNTAGRSLNEGTNNELTFQADYAHPWIKAVLMEVGAKTILRDITSAYNYDFKDTNGDYVSDLTKSNDFNYTQNVYAGYLSFNLTLSKGYAIKAGGRLERTEITGDFRNSQSNSITNNYNNFVPSLTVARTFKDMSSVKISYSRRIQRPGLRFLNPFIDSTDPQNISFGNPNLAPEKTDNFELGYSRFMGRSSVNASVYYRNTYDVIESIVGLSADGKISGSTYANISNSSSVGVNLSGSVQLGQRITLRGNANVYSYNVNDPNIQTTYSNKSVLYNVNANASWSLPKDFAIEAFGMFNSPRRTIQGENPSFSMFNLGFKKDFLEKRASLGLNMSNPFNKNREFTTKLSGDGFDQYQQNSVPFRSVGISFSYRFGKMDFSSQGGGKKGKGPKKEGINNDDIKQEEDSQGGGGGGRQ